MAPPKIKSKKQNIYIAAIIIIIGISGFLLYNSFLKAPETVSSDILAPPVSSTSFVTGFQTPENLIEYLNELVKFGDWPVKIGELGRSNPFLPL